MKAIKSFGLFWYDFVVGDDWTIAVGIAVAVAAVLAGAHHNLNLWWLLPFIATVMLGASLWRVSSPARRR